MAPHVVILGCGFGGLFAARALAGAFAEIARHTLHGEFRRFDPRNARVVLVEGTERVLPTYPPDLSERARRQLERLGVTVWLGRRVTGIDAEGVQLGATLGVPLDRAALNILNSFGKKQNQPFRYSDVGMLATIGRNSAVAVLGRLHLSGYPAWLLWLLAHIYFLIGFRNRIVVLIDWAWAYWTFERNARIVIGGKKKTE